MTAIKTSAPMAIPTMNSSKPRPELLRRQARSVDVALKTIAGDEGAEAATPRYVGGRPLHLEGEHFEVAAVVGRHWGIVDGERAVIHQSGGGAPGIKRRGERQRDEVGR